MMRMGPGVKEEPGPCIRDAGSSLNPLCICDADGGCNVCLGFCLSFQRGLASPPGGESLPKAAWNHLFPERPLHLRSTDALFPSPALAEEKKDSGSSP